MLRVLHHRASELLGMESWEASGLENKRVRLRCGYVSNLSALFVLPCAQDELGPLKNVRRWKRRGYISFVRVVGRAVVRENVHPGLSDAAGVRGLTLLLGRGTRQRRPQLSKSDMIHEKATSLRLESKCRNCGSDVEKLSD